jgi:hypothetical protein
MKSSFVRFICVLLPAVMTASTAAAPRSGDQTVGLLSKVILNVSHKAGTNDWSSATRGQTLNSGDMLRTGLRSLAIIKFKDNSMVRVRELSEVTLTTTLLNRARSKSVEVGSGGVGFSVTRQQTAEEFRFSSPTSVASIRGTAGLFATGGADTLVVIEGEVIFENKVSAKTVLVKAGFTGISSPDGSIITRSSNRGEQQEAETASRPGDQPRQLKMQLRNSRGEVKELILDFKD